MSDGSISREQLRQLYPDAMTEREFSDKYIRPAVHELARKFIASEELDELETKVLEYCLAAGPPVESRRII